MRSLTFTGWAATLAPSARLAPSPSNLCSRHPSPVRHRFRWPNVYQPTRTPCIAHAATCSRAPKSFSNTLTKTRRTPSSLSSRKAPKRHTRQMSAQRQTRQRSRHATATRRSTRRPPNGPAMTSAERHYWRVLRHWRQNWRPVTSHLITKYKF